MTSTRSMIGCAALACAAAAVHAQAATPQADRSTHAPAVTGTVASTAGYDASVKKLMAAADTLRDAIQEMAAQPAGPRRNQAIRDANRALLETQGAMANAYDLTAFPEHHASASVNVETMECVRLRSMTACHPG